MCSPRQLLSRWDLSTVRGRQGKHWVRDECSEPVRVVAVDRSGEASLCQVLLKLFPGPMVDDMAF